jgi:hypothetical protein
MILTAALITRVLAMRRRLFTPVTAGVSAARHVFWYLSYHTAARQRPER